jgi:hypothetical protein
MRKLFFIAIYLLLVSAVPADSQIRGLIAPGPTPELADKLKLFGQFVGDWEIDDTLINPDGSKLKGKGEWHFGWVLGGRAVQDMWSAYYDNTKPGAPTRGYGTTLRFYDSRLNAWRVVWVSPLGNNVAVFTAQQMALARPKATPYRWSWNAIRQSDRSACLPISSVRSLVRKLPRRSSPGFLFAAEGICGLD